MPLPQTYEHTQTAVITQATDAPGQLQVLLRSGPDSGLGTSTSCVVIPVRSDCTLACLTVQTHGLAWADVSGRIYAEQHAWVAPDIDPVDVHGGGVPRTTRWAGALVQALAWRDAATLVVGDTAGRLMAFDIGPSGSDEHQAVRCIWSGDSAWQAILPVDEGRMAAVSVDGDLVVLDNTGRLLDEERLPIGHGQITAARFCTATPLLIYQVSSGLVCPDTAVSSRMWYAWHLVARQAVPLPDTLRYADTIAINQSGVWAMNAQGMSWRWNPDPSASDLGVPSIHTAAPEPLTGWPPGPCREVIPLDHTPTLIRIDLRGRARTLVLDGDTWRSSADQLPEAQYRHLGVTEPGTLERDADQRCEVRARDLASQALQAHNEQRGDDCQRLLDQLEPLAPNSPRADVLRTRVAAERGDFIAALTHLRRAVMNDGFRNAALLTHYGRLLYRVGALDELACFDPCQWPTLAAELPADIDITALHGDAFCLIDTSPAPGSISRSKASGRRASVIQTLGRSNAATPDTGGEHSWQDLAWLCVRRWGSAGPYRLGAERFASLPLHSGDLDLFAEAMGVCGAHARAMAVFSATGKPHVTQGWVFSDPLTGTPMHRQLVAWRGNSPSKTISMCMAISAERYASPRDWCTAWDALQDTVWQADMRRRVAIVRESIHCGLAPDPGLLTRRAHDPAAPVVTHNDNPPSQHEEVLA